MFKALREAYTSLIKSLNEANVKVRVLFALDEPEPEAPATPKALTGRKDK